MSHPPGRFFLCDKNTNDAMAMSLKVFMFVGQMLSYNNILTIVSLMLHVSEYTPIRDLRNQEQKNVTRRFIDSLFNQFV